MYTPVTINIEEFLTAFNSVYTVCYKSEDQVVGFEEAVAAFDDFQIHHYDFIAEFVRFRGDAVTSDREAAAFMFALKGMLKDAEYQFV